MFGQAAWEVVECFWDVNSRGNRAWDAGVLHDDDDGGGGGGGFKVLFKEGLVVGVLWEHLLWKNRSLVWAASDDNFQARFIVLQLK